MPLQALLADVHPAWYAAGGEAGFDPQLVARARSSALGQRLLLRALPPSVMDGLLAPRPGGSPHLSTQRRWPRERVLALVRDLGVLACAPVIRAEVRREPVRWLRKVLGNSYLLALDRTVWDGRVDRAVQARLSSEWEALVADPRFLSDPALLGALLDRRGDAELRAWAARRNRPLADWTLLMRGIEADCATHLPEKAVLRVASHHENHDEDAA
ncbi:hypothetical protein [Luteimonas marina]|uniref:hypothetical protein n=1 Tax=Luteimonas marina TaxID=488485 RepID=UPI0013154608|nr:hypothetical protein [Luteimonas marina]